jgi:hypothetical protein
MSNILRVILGHGVASLPLIIRTGAHIPGTVITQANKCTGKLITLFYVVVNVGNSVFAVFTINPFAQVAA